MAQKYILGIETSCDETSAAVIHQNSVLSNIVSSQTIHEHFGGVVPELASRAHIKLITSIVEKAITSAKIKKSDLGGLAVTYGPGLVGALFVGLNFTKGLSQALMIPYIGINHIEGHIYGNFLTNPGIEFPHLSLVVSGGHTLLVIIEEHLKYKVVGTTRDDAVGEAFDKGAKMLGLSYPGGPVIDKLSNKGDPDFYRFPRAYLKGTNFDFSYSGLKTALLIYIEEKGEQFIKKNLYDVCASYQKAAVEVLVIKTINAAKKYRVNSIGIVGGVAANSLLRRWLGEKAEQNSYKFYVPELKFCTDNAAMIARAGLQRLASGFQADMTLNARPALKLGQQETIIHE